MPVNLALHLEAVNQNGVAATELAKPIRAPVPEADTALFNPAKRKLQRHVVYNCIVDAGRTGLNLAGQRLSFRAIASPDAAAQAKARVVGPAHRFFRVAHLDYRQNWPKGFF